MSLPAGNINGNAGTYDCQYLVSGPGEASPAPAATRAAGPWLPPAAQWNGKFLGAGNGGFAGSTGHQGPGGAWAIGHPEKKVDFAHRSTHEMTLKAKQLVQAFYDRAPLRSYFSSCSTGGRMAVMEAKRYPEDLRRHRRRGARQSHIRMWAALVNDLVTKRSDAMS